MKEKLFSIIVPAYQVEKYIDECIQSILPQITEEMEIVIVNDGSTDSTGDIVNGYADKYENIRVIYQENQGLSAARNTGIINASGEYCVFVDSDDSLCDDSLVNLKKCIEQNKNPDVVISRRKSVNSEGIIQECKYFFDIEKLSRLSSAQKYRSLQEMEDMWLGTWIFSVRTEYMNKNNILFPYGLLHEDEEWVPKMFLNTEKISFNNEFLYCNRIDREGSITQTPNIKREYDKIRIIELLKDEFKKEKYNDEIINVVEERIRSIYFGVLCNSYLYKGDSKFEDLVRCLKKKKYILRNSTRVIHKCCYFSFYIMGIKRTCFLLRKFMNVRRLF